MEDFGNLNEFKQSLDRWLTTQPDNGFTNFIEQVLDYAIMYFCNIQKITLSEYHNIKNNEFDKWLDNSNAVNHLLNIAHVQNETIQNTANKIIRFWVFKIQKYGA